MSSVEDLRIWFYKHSHDYLREQTLGPLKRVLPNLSNSDVLELGCGPGTHAAVLQHCRRYVGLDIEEAAIALARKAYSESEFLVADITLPLPTDLGQFDYVLIHSVLHHLDDQGVAAALNNVAAHLKSEGTFYLLDLLLPPRIGPAYVLAKLDRGDFPRTEEQWLEFVRTRFQIRETERYRVGLCGITGWHMLYLAAKPRR